VNDVDALHVLEGDTPVGPLLAHDDLESGERVVDRVVPGERVADELLLEDGRHGHLIKTRLHGPTPLTTGQVQPDVKTPDKGPIRSSRGTTWYE
jgi:hypothetical protein